MEGFYIECHFVFLATLLFVYYLVLYLIEQPVVYPGEHNVTLGSNVTFDCNEFGSKPFTYQWYMRNVTGDEILLTGKTDELYNIPSTMYSDTGGYFCEANNSLGIVSNSTPAKLLGKNVRSTYMYILGTLIISTVYFATKLNNIKHKHTVTESYTIPLVIIKTCH